MMTALRLRWRWASLAMVGAVAVTGMAPVEPVEASQSATIISTPDRRVTVGDFVLFRPSSRGVGVTFTQVPPDASASTQHGFFTWRPKSFHVGRHDVSFDLELAGGTISETVVIEVRNPPRSDVVMAVGDSIASGQGLERRDYLGLDSCHRDHNSNGSWTRRVFDTLVDDAPVGLEPAFHMVACGGARTWDIWSDAVSGGPSEVDDGSMTQLEWVIATNPRLVLMTIGANDLRFDHPTEMFDDGRLDIAVMLDRVISMRGGVSFILDEIVTKTDADVVITTVHNPTSRLAHGIDGCTGSCFHAATERVVDHVHQSILHVAAPHGDRVTVVDVGDVMTGHEAPNGRGPDGTRAGIGLLSRHLPIPTAGVHPYCQKGHADHDTWINAADCVHPNGEGHQAYADAVLEALTRRSWTW